MENNSTVAPARMPREIRSALAYINKRLRKALEGEHKRLRKQYYDTHKDAHGYMLCPVTGKRLHFEQLSVDHITPFYLLRNQWLRERGIPIQKGRKITTEEVLDWQVWHQQHARVRVMDKHTNREHGLAWYGQAFTWQG